MALQANVGRGSPTYCVSRLKYCSASFKDDTGTEKTHNIHHPGAIQTHPARVWSPKRNYHKTIRGFKFRTPASMRILHVSFIVRDCNIWSIILFSWVESSRVLRHVYELRSPLSLSFHRAFCSLFNYAQQPKHIYIYIYILFKKSKIYIKTLKTLLHVSITRSSSGSIHCSLLILWFKTKSFTECIKS